MGSFSIDASGVLVISSMKDLAVKKFMQNEEVTEVKIAILDAEESVDLPDYMFFQCINLRKAEFYNDIGTIGKGCFCGCGLTEAHFFKSVSKIEMGAFAVNPLTTVRFHRDCIVDSRAFEQCGTDQSPLILDIPAHAPFLSDFCGDTNTKKKVQPEQVLTSAVDGSAIPRITVAARNFNVRIGKKQILSDINLDIHSGQMIMVIGGSGTGKTTLIKHLFGLERCDSPVTIQVGDNAPVTAPASSRTIKNLLKDKVFYAPQFTISNGYLTVEEELQKTAKMYTGRYMSQEELKELAQTFRLWDDDKKMLSTLVKRISGGQKKKLLMACSRISDPQILVFDEPDSGLDEPSAFNLFIHDMKREQVEKLGKTVIVVSHHPHKYMNMYLENNKRLHFHEIFDQLIVLGKINSKVGSSIVFCGDPYVAREYFELENSDPYSRIISKAIPMNEGGESDNEKIQEYVRKYQLMVDNAWGQKLAGKNMTYSENESGEAGGVIGKLFRKQKGGAKS